MDAGRILGAIVEEVRKEKKASNTETAFNSIKKEIEKSNIAPNEYIKLAVEKSWKGFKAEWVNNLNINNNGKNKVKEFGFLSQIDINKYKKDIKKITKNILHF